MDPAPLQDLGDDGEVAQPAVRGGADDDLEYILVVDLPDRGHIAG